jgi:predicted N-acetyltransferase YhbS
MRTPGAADGFASGSASGSAGGSGGAPDTARVAPQIVHLFEVPEHRAAMAALIHDEFWLTVPGASAECMAARLAEAACADRVPLALVAVHEGQAIGVVNLVESDDDHHPEWTPWLAGMVVAEGWRGRGVGSALVRELLVRAQRLGVGCLYFGTDGPRFYARLGAVLHEQARPGFWFMRFDLAAEPAAEPTAEGAA